jgi:hypothetical protein
VQHGVDHGGFAMIDVGDDGDIPNLLDRLQVRLPNLFQEFGGETRQIAATALYRRNGRNLERAALPWDRGRWLLHP